MPRMAVSHGAPERGVADAADPDRRMRRSHRPRSRVDIFKRNRLTFVARYVVGPKGFGCRQVIIGNLPAPRERDSESLIFLLGPADADTQNEPAVREPIQVADHLRRV